MTCDNVKKLAFVFLLVGSGCAATIDSVEDHLRTRWNTEWKAALTQELSATAAGLATQGKDQAISEMVRRLEAYDEGIQGKLTALGVDVASHDVNQDGKMQLAETLALVKDIKEKSENSPIPMDWWQIMLLVAGAYFPATTLKETLKSKMSKPRVV